MHENTLTGNMLLMNNLGFSQRKAASEFLRSLENFGILECEKVGREVVYRHPALNEVLSKRGLN